MGDIEGPGADGAEPALGCGTELGTLTNGGNTNPSPPPADASPATPPSDRPEIGALAVREGCPERLGPCVGLLEDDGLPDGEGLGLGVGEGDGEGLGDGLGLGEGDSHGFVGWPQGFALADTPPPAGTNTQMPTIKAPAARTFLIVELCLPEPEPQTDDSPNNSFGIAARHPRSEPTLSVGRA
jgi:hypothetical protein